MSRFSGGIRSGRHTGAAALGTALVLTAAGPGWCGQVELALLGEAYRADGNVAGPDAGLGAAAGVQVDWPVAESWSVIADARYCRQESTLPFGVANQAQLVGGFRLFPFGTDHRAPLFLQLEAGWVRLDLAQRARPVDRPLGVFAVGQRIRVADRWAVLWEARGQATPSDIGDPIRQRITEPGVRLGISYRLGRPDGDADRDGVPDPLDACPDTPAGARVDAAGCPLDRDRDGVPDGLDRCPGTPRGLPVDATGCSPLRDSDGDGIPDGVDACPETAPGQRVDERGCPTDEPMARAIPPLQLQDVVFRVKSVQLPPEALAILNDVAAALATWPEVTVEIAGEQDPGTGTGPELAVRRAESVRAYLVARGVPPEQLRVAPRGERAQGAEPRVKFVPEVPQ